MPARRAVYTVLMGDYEKLNHQSARPGGAVEFLCLTDDPELTSETWTIVRVQPAFPADPVRSQRMLKILGHSVLDRFDETLYVDNAVRLLGDADAILDEWLDGHDIALHAHSYRSRVVDEFDEVLALNYDDAARITEQLLHYAATSPEALDDKPLWTAMLARRRTPLVEAAMRTWGEHVLRYSRRDQLSITLALRANALSPRIVEADNFRSAIHEWPSDVRRRVEQGKAPKLAVGPMLVEFARMERRVETAERDVAQLTVRAEQAEAALGALRDEIGAARAGATLSREVEADALAALERSEAAARSRATELAELRASSSWRITAPARALVRLIRGR